MIDKIQWALRWIVLGLSLLATIYTVATWQNIAVYHVAALTVVTIYLHSALMLLGIWHQRKIIDEEKELMRKALEAYATLACWNFSGSDAAMERFWTADRKGQIALGLAIADE